MNKLLISLGLDLSDWNSRTNKMKRQWKSLTGKMGQHLGTAIKGGLAAGAAAFSIWGAGEIIASHERSFEGLQKVTKTTGAEIQNLRNDVYDLNKELGLKSYSDAANLMKDVAKQSRLTGEDLKQLTYQTGLLGKEYSSQEDQLAAQTALMRAFKTSVGEAGDVMAYLNAQGGDLKGELLESVKEYSVQFSEAGFNMNQSVAILKSGLEQGWNVDKAADAFKEGRLRLMGGDKATVDALGLLGLSDLDSQIKSGAVGIPKAMGLIQGELSKLNKTEQFRIAKEIFGAQYEDIGGDAMSAMLIGMQNEVKTTGSLDLLTQDMQGRWSYKWDQALSSSSNAFGKLIDTIKPHLVPLVEWFGQITGKLSDFVDKYQYITKTVGAGIGIFMAMALILASIHTGAGVLKAAFTLLTSPIGLIIAGVALLGYGLYWLEKKTGIFSETWKLLSPLIDEVWIGLQLLWDEVKGLGLELLNLIPGFDDFKAGFDVKLLAQAFKDNIELFVIAPFKAGVKLFENSVKLVRSLIKLFTGGFKEEDLAKTFGIIGDLFTEPFEIFFDTNLGKMFKDTISGWGDSLYATLMKPINKIRNSKLGKFFNLDTEDEEPSALTVAKINAGTYDPRQSRARVQPDNSGGQPVNTGNLTNIKNAFFGGDPETGDFGTVALVGQ
jgi:TP901 family phage tail tape measure protein